QPAGILPSGDHRHPPMRLPSPSCPRRPTMSDLRDGESVEMKGSASRPYVLKNVGSVYSCSCPAWRNQSLPIERRTCKHLRRLRGDAAETARVGSNRPASLGAETGGPADAAGTVAPPP